MSKVNMSARPETIGSRAVVDYFIALHSVPHLNDIHQYSDKSTADRARGSVRGEPAQCRDTNRIVDPFGEFLRSCIRAHGLVDDMIQGDLAVAE